MTINPDPETTMNRQWAEAAFAPSQSDLPFSFVYGGQSSSNFLHTWSRAFKEEKLSETVLCRTVTVTDPDTRLEVKAVCRIYLDTPGVDWTLYFTNLGDTVSPILEHIQAVDVRDRAGDTSKVILHRLNGSLTTVEDWMPFDQELAAGQRIDFSATAGRSTNLSPWFNLDWGSGGVITTIGWSGQWQASVAFQDGCVQLQAGMQTLHTVLQPGESLRSPRILQLRWLGGDVDHSYNAFRRTMFAHILPRIAGQLVTPPIVHLSTSFYELNDSNEQNVLSHLDSIKGLGFEMFWLDAYWTGPDGFPNSMGNYRLPLEQVEPVDRFPHGLKAIGEAVERAGLGFLMWFEPERVAPGTFIAREHPEWVMSPAGDGSGLFNLGIPEARQHMTRYLNEAIRVYKLSCLRIDYNIDPLSYWQFMDAKDPQRAGMAEMRYVEGLYRMWDDILAANPGLFIDDCAGGGRRIDLEAVSRAVPLWRSDNTCDMLDLKPETIVLAALKNQLMSDGLNRYVPFSTCGQMGASPYLFRSGFNAGIAFCQDVRPETYPRDLLRQGIAEGKRIRKYFFGNYYPLVEAGIDPRGWTVLQYHRPGEDDGMIMAFRRDQSEQVACQLQLREIDRAARYTVKHYVSYELEETVSIQGSELQNLQVTIDEKPGSVLIEYSRC
jgi:alpha-galactosidase